MLKKIELFKLFFILAKKFPKSYLKSTKISLKPCKGRIYSNFSQFRDISAHIFRFKTKISKFLDQNLKKEIGELCLILSSLAV